MDDIWWKAVKKLRKHEECISAGPETKPAVIAAATTTPTVTIHNKRHIRCRLTIVENNVIRPAFSMTQVVIFSMIPEVI
jgi:hypothetical protein